LRPTDKRKGAYTDKIDRSIDLDQYYIQQNFC